MDVRVEPLLGQFGLAMPSPLQILSPATLFQEFYELAYGFFVVLVGNQRGVGRMDDDAVFNSQRGDEMIVARPDDRARRVDADVAGKDRVSVLIDAAEAGQRLPTADVVPGKRGLDHQHLGAVSMTA